MPGVSVEGKLQSSDCANKKFDNVIKQIVKMLVRAFFSDMVFQDLDNEQNKWNYLLITRAFVL